MPMRFYFFFVLFIALFHGTLFGQEATWKGYTQTPETVKPDPGVLRHCLLKTGFLVQGSLDLEGTHYTVKTEYGTMRVPAGNVEFVGTDRDDVYRYKSNLVDRTNCAQMMKLAEWCLRNHFREKGIEAFEQALKLAPNAMMRDLITQRIETARASDRGPESTVPFSNIQVVGRENASEEDAELARWIDGVPPSVLDLFVKKVQPVLTSRCASVDCHGSRSENGFRIRMPYQSKGRTSYHNLKETMQWVDLEHPASSPLVSALVTVHGGKKPPYNVESVQYAHFLEWIQLTVKDLPLELNERLMAKIREERGVLPAPILPPTVVLDTLPKSYHEALLAKQNSHPKTGPTSFFASEPPSQDLKPLPSEPIRYTPTRLVVSNTDAETDEAADPFDPKRFNLLHHREIIEKKEP